MKSYNFCNNCGKNGHLFHQCKNPITKYRDYSPLKIHPKV